eukprot:snap_masked-scaffold_29-processed-gene-3.4-mRNA-1 protein AED:1.00 eAED:1.00 QI:0/0/0/0/1/1/2/0/165
MGDFITFQAGLSNSLHEPNRRTQNTTASNVYDKAMEQIRNRVKIENDLKQIETHKFGGEIYPKSNLLDIKISPVTTTLLNTVSPAIETNFPFDLFELSLDEVSLDEEEPKTGCFQYLSIKRFFRRKFSRDEHLDVASLFRTVNLQESTPKSEMLFDFDAASDIIA